MAAVEPSDEIAGYERSPVDVVRMVTFGAVCAALTAAMAFGDTASTGFEADLYELLSFVNEPIERIVTGVLQLLVAITTLALLIGPLLRRRIRPALMVLVAMVAAALVMAVGEWILDRPALEDVVDGFERSSSLTETGAGSTASIAQLTAGIVVSSVFVTVGARRALRWLLATVVVLRLIVPVQLPLNVVVAVPLGLFVGAAVLYAFGRPTLLPSAAVIRHALARSNLDVVDLRAASVDARGSTPYFATLAEGGGLFVKVVGEGNRAADLLFRAYRRLRMRNIGDEEPFSTLRRAVEHEAFLSLLARDVGVRTPRIRAVATAGPDALLMAIDLIDGSSLDAIDVADIDDQLMREVWDQVAVLREHRIAHRDLRLANVFIGPDGRPWLIDFGFAEAAVEDEILAADVAQLLASFAVRIEPARVVRAAIDSLGVDTVAAAIPRLQLPALSGATRTALKELDGRFEELRTVALDRSGRDDVEYEPIERFTIKTLLMIVVLVGVVYFLVPQLADLPQIIEEIAGGDWSRTPMLAVLSAVTYVGATMSIRGAVAKRLPIVTTFITQVASSFASKVAPAGLGGMALNVRYIQKQGVDTAIAVSGVGLNTAGGFVMHVTLTVIFLVWAGPGGLGSIELPDIGTILFGVCVLAVLGGAMFAVPGVRAVVTYRAVPVIKRGIAGALAVARSPYQLVLLLGGSAVVTLSYISSLYVAMLAFGGDLRFATVGVFYLAGSALAAAVPTPGGLGAVEAALVAGLIAAGLDNTVAVPAVFFYRVFTFWLPILPGWACFAWLQRKEYI